MKRRVSPDSETWRLRPGIAVPRMVCGQIGEIPLIPGFDGRMVPDVGPPGTGVFDKPHDPIFRAVDSRLYLPDDYIRLLHGFLDDPEIDIIGQNICFDFAVAAHRDPSLLPKIFAAYDANRIEDIRIREKLILLAQGRLADEGESGAKLQEKFNLAAIVARNFDVDISESKKQKPGEPLPWRLRFAELDGVPLDQWPEEPKKYALDDPRWNLTVYDAQEKLAEGPIPDSHSQARHSWWIHLMAVWGVRTDREAVAVLEADLREKLAHMDKVMREAGILQSKMVGKRGSSIKTEKWSKNMKALQAMTAEAYGGAENTPHTGGRVNKEGIRTPAISTKKEVLVATADPKTMEIVDRLRKENPDWNIRQLAEAAAAEAPATGLRLVHPPDTIYRWIVLRASGERDNVAKVLSTFIPVLQRGTSMPINARWNELVASGRISCLDPNLTNLPRKGGLRECFAPRKGHVYAIADYSYIELVTLAQTCLDRYGWSRLADTINAGLDPHLAMAAEMLGISYEEALARKKAGDPVVLAARQASKAVGFGYPGGLGALKMVAYAKAQYGVIMSEDEAKEHKKTWYKKYPEMRLYHRDGGDLAANGEYQAVQAVSGRVRGGLGYCAGLNTMFQGRTADGAKWAGWLVSKECYLEQPYATVEEYLASGLELVDGKMVPSTLYGARIVLFVHDELVLECLKSRGHVTAKRLVQVMKNGMREYVTDIRIGVEECLTDRWRKGAEAVFDEKGELTLWFPKGQGPKTEKGVPAA